MENKLTIEECRKYLKDAKISDEEIIQIRDFCYEFSDIIISSSKSIKGVV